MDIASDGNIFTTHPEPLADLLKGIEKHKVALPNFQRPWVWEPEMVHSLIISVAYRYPAGSLLTMPVASGGFALRPFQGAGDDWKATPNLMILDGQQRLTSLYQALYSRDGVKVKGRTYHFYLDIPTLLSDDDGDIAIGTPVFDKALFYVSEEKDGRRVRYVGLQPKDELTTPEHELRAGALPLWSIFDGNGYLSEWQKKYQVRKSGNDMTTFLALDDEWKALVQPWIDRIRTYPFPVVQLSEDMPLGAICHIFEKVNSTGVPLDVFDLCTAILWAQGFELNNEWAKLKNDKLKGLLPMQELHGTYFLQGLSLLDSMERKRTSTGGNTGVACRKQDLMNMDKDAVVRWWSVLVDGYFESAKFMSEQGILSNRILPYSTLIIPLTAIFGYLRAKHNAAFVGSAWSKVQQWYWCSVFSQRYSSQVEYTAAQDFEQVVNWLEGGPEPEVLRTFMFRSDYLQEITSIRNAIYKGVLCLLARDGARDFTGGAKLTTDLFFDTRQDHHHIFPREALRKLKVDDRRSESVINKTLISAAVNRSIGGRLPSQYTKLLSERIDKNDPTAFDGIVESHAVSSAHLRTDDWEGFVLHRREQLKVLIENACGKMAQPFTEVVVPDEMDVDEEEDS